MHGNVWEWVADDWHDRYDGAPADDFPWIHELRASDRVTRGGSWHNDAQHCRSAIRDSHGPSYINSNLGFRLAKSVAPGP
jgi:formylglycine-generating enzyme required for sulfatase activity